MSSLLRIHQYMFDTKTRNAPVEPPLPVLSIAIPPVAVKVLAPVVDVVGTFDPLTFFIWLRTWSRCRSYNHAAC
jgi:hypothetical protein